MLLVWYYDKNMPARAYKKWHIIKRVGSIRFNSVDFIMAKLVPEIPNDGKRTPMRGHAAFIVEHVTAIRCQGCL